MRKTVLVTAIGTVTATAVVRELKKTGEFYLIGADINERQEIATSLDVDEFYQFPLATDEKYLPFVLSFCKEHQVAYYYAVIDQEVVKISEMRDQFEAIGTRLCVANFEFARICHYKNLFGEWIAANHPEAAIREYRTMEAAWAAKYPLFIKPSEGVASAGCRRIDTYEELAASVKAEEVGSKILVQDHVVGRNVTVDCVRNEKTGQKMQIQRRELLRNSNGCGIAVEIFHDPRLEKICCALMDELGLNGVCNMEFFETEEGFKIIEINPRFSAGTLYSCMSGANIVRNAMQIADGEDCELGTVSVGARFAERYEAYRMDSVGE